MKKMIVLFSSLFIVTGLMVVFIDAKPDSSFSLSILPFKSLLFGIHMAGWMILGMMANYLWDLFKSGGSLKDIHLPDLLLPILVSPIVFFTIWSMWPDQKIAFAINLVAFQNGFFWQVILSKSGSIVSSSNDKNITVS